MDSKKIAAQIEALDAKHVKDAAARASAIAAADKDRREAETLLKEAIEKVRRLQHDNTNASFAYDAEHAELARQLEQARKQEAA